MKLLAALGAAQGSLTYSLGLRALVPISPGVFSGFGFGSLGIRA